MAKRTRVDENMSLQVVPTPEGSITVVANEVLLHFVLHWTVPILVHHHHLNT